MQGSAIHAQGDFLIGPPRLRKCPLLREGHHTLESGPVLLRSVQVHPGERQKRHLAGADEPGSPACSIRRRVCRSQKTALAGSCLAPGCGESGVAVLGSVAIGGPVRSTLGHCDPCRGCYFPSAPNLGKKRPEESAKSGHGNCYPPPRTRLTPITPRSGVDA
jgi:hypothetical protein